MIGAAAADSGRLPRTGKYMNNYLDLVDCRWSFGSYYRRQFLDDTLYTCFFYKDLEFVLDRSAVAVRDKLALELAEAGAVDKEVLEQYHNRVQRFLDQLECFDQWSLEQIYGAVHGIRKQYLGAGTIEKAYINKGRRRRELGNGADIDQSQVLEELLKCSRSVLFCLADPEYYQYMENDMRRAAEMGLARYVIAGSAPGDTLLSREALEELAGGEEAGPDTGRAWGDVQPTGRADAELQPVIYLEDKTRYSGLDLSAVRYSEALQGQIDRGEAFLLIYGDDGLFHCRNLKLDAIVRTAPSCYYSRALAGQFVGNGLCTIYVPAHFDIMPWVPLREKTRISYRQLARICADHGRDIYRMGADELYFHYPEYFINIYGEEGKEMLPVSIRRNAPELAAAREAGEDIYGAYCRIREQRIAEYLNGVAGIHYVSAYMVDGSGRPVLEAIPSEAGFVQVPVPWSGGAGPAGVLVQGAVMAQAKGSRVIFSDGCSRSPRELVANGQEEELMLISNFLFFLTPKLAGFYNELRRDRPLEQIDFDGGHLDYMLRWDGERRTETFPLYRKACIAMKEDGSFLFFRFLLGGGRIELGGEAFSWEKGDVNSVQEPGEICIYTPYLTRDRVEDKADDFRETVGEGRFNLVVIQNRVICARLGVVVLPSIGVVVSLSVERGLALAEHLKLENIGDGYSRCGKLRVSVRLDPPEGISAAEWKQVRWAYGGGMSLISNGAGIYEDGFPADWLRDEGWLCPLSRQTQESEIHRPSRHPRTAVGVTEKGELFVLVFSGRTSLSRGADYGEMSRIARKLVPGVLHMMNVDGGGSAVFGMARNKVFMELSCPATSYSSPAGMVRQINTILCMKQ